MPKRSGGRAGRVLAAAELDAWAAYTAQVAPLPGRARPRTTSPPNEPAPPVAPASAPTGARSAAPKPDPSRVPDNEGVAIGQRPAGLDGGSWTRFSGGRMRPERVLDLHGRTVQQAHDALHAFLHRARADRLRCVEVITGRGSGRGSGEAGGAIRRELPWWLETPALRGHLLAAAHPHQANPGSVRLLLRRAR